MNIKYTLINLFTDKNVPVHSLYPKKDIKLELNKFLQRNFYIIIFLFLVMIMLIFVGVCFVIAGAGVESGNYYYHLQKVI